VATVQHVVKEGETLEDIAAQFYAGDESRAELLREVNGISLVEVLQAGRTIIVPLIPIHFVSVVEQTSLEAVVELGIQPSAFVRVPVAELMFPGIVTSHVPVQGKWIYALVDKKLVFSVEARGPKDWWVQRIESPGPELVNDDRLLLERSKTYRFMLSPIKLSPSAERRLAQNVHDCQWLTSVADPASFTADAPILLRDPFQWAADLHDRHYLPRLEEWQVWMSDGDRAARRFVASAFKTFIDGGDKLGIANELVDGEPARYLNADRDAEKSMREAAERAAHYLASWIDSEDHRIVESAHIDGGTDMIERAVVHWACVVGDLNQTFEGRQLLNVVAQDPQLIPRRFVITDDPPVALRFSELRYLSLAARAVLTQIGPAVLDVFYPSDVPSKRDAVKRYLERFGENRVLEGVYKLAHDNIKAGRPLGKKVHPKKKLRKLELEARHAWQAAYVASLPSVLVKSEKLKEAYERNLNHLDKTALFGLEALNLVFALQELAETEPGDKDAKLLAVFGVAGASADAGLMIIEVFEILKGTTKRAVGGVLGVISGYCDMVAFSAAQARASTKYDESQAFGHGVAAAGAGGVMFGSAFALASLGATGATAASLVSLGALFGGVGALLIGAGVTFAALTADNAYEDLAKFSFLGKKRDKAVVELEWSPVGLPALQAPEAEVMALLSLISSFNIELNGKTIVFIEPTFYRAGDVLELYLETEYSGNLSDNACLVEIDLTSGEAVQVKGLRALEPRIEPTFDAEGRITSIRFDVVDVVPSTTFAFIWAIKVHARLRLAYPSRATLYAPAIPFRQTGRKEPWVQIEWQTVGGGHKAASNDEGMHINRFDQPMNPGMKVFNA
jgi:hypothetical protein